MMPSVGTTWNFSKGNKFLVTNVDWDTREVCLREEGTMLSLKVEFQEWDEFIKRNNGTRQAEIPNSRY